MTQSPAWRVFWERTNSPAIELEAADYVRRLVEYLRPSGTENVLDFGCGFGHVATGLSPHVGSIGLWDRTEAVLREAAESTSLLANVKTVDLSDPSLESSFDVILLNSVLQYIPTEDLPTLLKQLRRLISSGGQVILSDVPTTEAHLGGETLEWIRFNRRQGKLGQAITFAIGNWRRYSSARREQPLILTDRTALARTARSAGFDTRVLDHNLTFRAGRSTFLLTPASSSEG